MRSSHGSARFLRLSHRHGPRSMDAMTKDVVVLGLGRMGRAMVERFVDQGVRVASWNRSGGGADGTAAAAVAHGGPVVLALFDAHACREVLDQVHEHVAGRLVVVTSTVGVDEVEGLEAAVTSAGGRFVHAPVMGSVPAVRAGGLRVLAGGASAHVEEARAVLAPVAEEVRHIGTPREAAAAKLVANSSLAGAMLALRDSLSGAAALGLPLAAALDVLELGRLRAVVAAVRPRLEQPGETAHFTVAALAKDLGLLAAAGGLSGSAERLRSLVADGALRDEDDVSAVALPTAYRTVRL